MPYKSWAEVLEPEEIAAAARGVETAEDEEETDGGVRKNELLLAANCK